MRCVSEPHPHSHEGATGRTAEVRGAGGRRTWSAVPILRPLAGEDAREGLIYL